MLLIPMRTIPGSGGGMESCLCPVFQTFTSTIQFSDSLIMLMSDGYLHIFLYKVNKVTKTYPKYLLTIYQN